MIVSNNFDRFLKRVATVLITVAPLFSQGAFKPGYDVKASSIRPQWEGAEPGVWTMDYQAALDQAKQNEKWTVMLYSGMWWCPHCQPLEANVLEQTDWKAFVAEQGLYCTVLDFPYRDGESNFCWLWETNYLAEAGMTLEDGQREIEARYQVQDRYAVPGAAVQSCASLAVPGTTNTYRRIGYPTILMIRPNGQVAGRFSVSKTFAIPDYVLTRARQILEADEWDETDDSPAGATEIPEPEGELKVVTNGVHTLSIVDKTDWYRFTVAKSASYQTLFRLTAAGDRKSVPLTVSIYASPTDTVAVVSESIDPSAEVPLTTILKAGEWYLKVQPADPALEEVVGYVMAREYVPTSFKPGYDVKASRIRPQWEGAEPGVWTMDYQSALDQAKQNEKWTVMLYSGMWWCPHCQPLEANVLDQADWKAFVAELGLYCTVLDFPYRDGVSNFCWLWDEGFLAEAGMTREDGQREIEARYQVQDRYAVPGAAVQSCASLVETGKTNTYHRIGYPTILMIRPDGRVAGRFSVSKTFANPDYVLTRARQILEADEWDEADDYATGATEIPEPACEETLVAAGVHTLSVVDRTDWYSFTVAASQGYQTKFHFTTPDGKESAPLQVSIFASPTDANAVATAVVDPQEGTPFTAILKAGTWYLKVQPADSSLAEVVGYELSREYAMAPATVKFKTTSLQVNGTSASVSLVVQIANVDVAADISLAWVAVDGTAVYPSDFAMTEGTLDWESGEVKKEKKITIPLVDPGVWKGDRSFTVKLFPVRHCEVPEEVASCEVKIKETRKPVPGTLSFEEVYQKEKPVLKEGETFCAVVTRTAGSDGCVTGTVSITDQALKNVVVTNLVWAHGDVAPKSFSFTFQDEKDVQKDRSGKFALRVTGGARAGKVTAINFVRRDELLEQPFDEYNKTVLQKMASQTGDVWFYGYDPVARGAGAMLRSDVLSAKGSKLTVKAKGPAVLVLEVGLHQGATAQLASGKNVMATTFEGPIEVAIPKNGMTLTLTCAAGEEAGAFVSAEVKVVPLADLKFIACQPFNKSLVPVRADFYLQGGLTTNALPTLLQPLYVETFVGSPSLPKAAIATNELTATVAEMADSAVLEPLQIVGKSLQWRMDVVYTDAFGGRAVVAGDVSKVTFVAADAPQADLAAGVPEGWTKTDAGAFECPPLTVGVLTDLGPIPLANIPDGVTAAVSVLNGRLPNGVKAVVDEQGVWLRGVPSVAGDFEFDLKLTARGKVAGKNVTLNGASIRMYGTVEPLGSAVGVFDGLRMVEETSGKVVAGLGTAQLTVGKTGSISGSFTLNASNFTFRATSFTARDGELFDVGCVTAKCGRATCALSLRLVREHGEEELKDVALTTEGGEAYWLYRTDWKTPERKSLLAEVTGAYTAALRVVAAEPTEGAPTAPGYLTVTVKEDGTARFAGVDVTGKSFSGSSPIFRMQDCCNGTGWMWAFYVSVVKGTYQVGGLVAIEPDVANPSVRYLSSADDAGVVFANGDPKTVAAYTTWRVQTMVVGGNYDKDRGLPIGSTWALAEKVSAFADYEGRVGESGFELVRTPMAGELVLTTVSAKKAQWEENTFGVLAPNFANAAGTFTFNLPLVYMNGSRTKVMRLAVKGVFVQNSQEGTFWTGLCPFKEKVSYLAENGKIMYYNVDTYLGVYLK